MSYRQVLGIVLISIHQSWHFLGPVTKFQDRSKPVIYEIAQATLIVENNSPELDEIDFDGITVRSDDEVLHTF